ncbi:unnamed protein product [Lampetra fluviatilis]
MRRTRLKGPRASDGEGHGKKGAFVEADSHNEPLMRAAAMERSGGAFVAQRGHASLPRIAKFHVECAAGALKAGVPGGRMRMRSEE